MPAAEQGGGAGAPGDEWGADVVLGVVRYCKNLGCDSEEWETRRVLGSRVTGSGLPRWLSRQEPAWQCRSCRSLKRNLQQRAPPGSREQSSNSVSGLRVPGSNRSCVLQSL